MRRVVACLDVHAGQVVKGTRFVDLREWGDPVACAARHAEGGADEIVFLDITATVEGRATLFELARRTAERLFVPLTLGGGIAGSDDMGRALRSGADKVAINSAAVARPALIAEAAARFGAQCVVASIDARRVEHRWQVVVRGGREATALDAVEWAQECARLGAGEILLTSIDRDGGRDGYDLELIAAVAGRVAVPVVASGGGATARHLADAFAAGAEAALLAGVLHEGITTIAALKRELVTLGVPVRSAA